MSRNAPTKEKAAHTRTKFLSWNTPIKASVPFSRTFSRQICPLKLAQWENVLYPSSETSQMNMPISGRRKIPASLEWALFVAEDSSTFKLITSSFQLEISLWRRKISILICLIKGLRNQVALIDLLTSSSECRSFLLFLICRKLSH